jgi:hypothetical protein
MLNADIPAHAIHEAQHKEQKPMPVEPPRKITETQIIRREEGKGPQQKKKPTPPKDGLKKEPERPGKVDIKI